MRSVTARTFQVHTPAAADIASVVLVRPGAPTHAFDMDQRLVELSFTVGSGVLNVTAPPNGNIAPPGYYMLFILNAAGVPSVAKFVQLSGTAPAESGADGNHHEPGGQRHGQRRDNRCPLPERATILKEASAHMPGRSRAAILARARRPLRGPLCIRRPEPTLHR